MKQVTKKITALLLTVIITTLISCGGGGSSGVTLESDIDFFPNFTPSSSASLSDLAENTFSDNGIDITTSPRFIDFNEGGVEIEKDDEVKEQFTVINNSGQDLGFSFQIFAISGGFSILDENEQNLGSWQSIEIADGDSETFYLQFNAWLFGTQTSYITITTDSLEGYIQFPMRASVTGDGEIRIIPTGYFCTDETAPDVDTLDFLKVTSGQTYTHGIKLCNNSGDDLSVFEATIVNDDSDSLSAAFDNNAFEDFLWQVSDEIDNIFSFGSTPTTTQAFQEPTLIYYTGDIDNASDHYDINVQHTGDNMENLLVEAGKLLTMDVNFSPDVSIEAGNGSLFHPISVNAKLKLDTSAGMLEFPLLGATSGVEPSLKMEYRLTDVDSWHEVDLISEGAAIYFGTAEIYLDWVSNNTQVAEIKIENVGSGSTSLEFYGDSLLGFFEYFWEDTDEELTFPIIINAGDLKIFKIRYLPSPTSDLDNFVTHWDFGQFHFQHTGGNGPIHKATLVGEQTAGYASQLFLGGAELNREYPPGQYKNLCVFKTDAADSTPKTFTVYNNNKLDTMDVTWSISDLDGVDASPTSSNGTIEILPESDMDFKINFTAHADMAGKIVSGTLTVVTEYTDKESEPTA